MPKVSELNSNPSLSVDDLVYVVDSPSGSPASYKATIGSVIGLSLGIANTWTAAQTFSNPTFANGTIVIRQTDNSSVFANATASQGISFKYYLTGTEVGGIYADNSGTFRIQSYLGAYIAPGYGIGLYATSDSYGVTVYGGLGLKVRNLANSADAPITASTGVFSGSVTGASFIVGNSSIQDTSGTFLVRTASATNHVYIGNSNGSATSYSMFLQQAGQNRLTLGTNSRIAMGPGNQSPAQSYSVHMNGANTGYGVLLLTGTASSPGDLIRAEDSSNAVMFSIASGGAFVLGDYSATNSTKGTINFLNGPGGNTHTMNNLGFTTTQTVAAGIGNFTGTLYSSGSLVFGTPGADGFAPTISNNSSNLYLLTHTGAVQARFTSGSGSGYAPFEAATGKFTSVSTSAITMIVKAIASQTANLSEWQNSSSVAVANITSVGRADMYGIRIHCGSGIGVKYFDMGYTGLNLQIHSTGVISWNAASPIGATFDAGISRNAAGILEINNGTAGSWASLRVGAYSSSTIGLIVKGATSQTANLQEWQDSSGGIPLKVTSSGALVANNLSGTDTFKMDASGFYSVYGSNYGLYFTSSNVSGSQQAYFGGDGTITGALKVNTVDTLTYGGFVVGPIGLNFRYQSNSTYHRETGYVTSGFQVNTDASRTGYIAVNTYYVTTAQESIRCTSFSDQARVGIGGVAVSGQRATIYAGVAAEKVFVIQGAASQSGNLQEWQNSSGTILANLSANGTLISTVGVVSPAFFLTAAYNNFYTDSGGIRLGSTSTIRFYSTASVIGTTDTGIARNAAGVIEINSGTAGTLRDLKVRDVISAPSSSITPANNGDLVVEATSNTTITFKLKGSDGTVRTGTITLT